MVKLMRDPTDTEPQGDFIKLLRDVEIDAHGDKSAWATANHHGVIATALAGSAMADELPRLLDDHEVARLLCYRSTTAFRRSRKRLEAEGFPKRRPVVGRYSPTEIKTWIDGGDNQQQQSPSDPLLELVGQWGTSK